MALPQPGPAAQATQDADRRCTLLLVEDEILIRMDIGDQLRLAGWTVYEASTADAAIEVLRSPILVDLVLTDVRMPGTSDGITLAAVVRRERPGVRVVVMSGHYVPNGQDQHLFDGFVAKPLDTEQLIRQLSELIAGSGRTRGGSL